jgi:hypothetical protein
MNVTDYLAPEPWRAGNAVSFCLVLWSPAHLDSGSRNRMLFYRTSWRTEEFGQKVVDARELPVGFMRRFT